MVRTGSERGLPPARVILVAGAAFVLTLLLCGLGYWQVERLAWKLDLIEKVDTRVHAEPQPAPGPAEWSDVSRENAEYTRVTVSGTFLNDKETAVLAVTDFGRGYWIITPLVTEAGHTVLVNRGFVPSEYRDAGTRPAGLAEGQSSVTGLLRITEPDGGFLRENDPKTDSWYSRDVARIAAARDLDRVAPFFIDADATPNPGGLPRGGLTVIAFSNSHLVYAVTWFVLAAMMAAAGFYVVRDWRRSQPQD